MLSMMCFNAVIDNTKGESIMSNLERYIGYAVIIVVLFLGINHVNAVTWQVATGENFEGNKVCKLLTVNEREMVVFGLINGQVIFASGRPLWNIYQDRGGYKTRDITKGHGMRMDGEFFQGTMYNDDRYDASYEPTANQMFLTPYSEAANDRFVAQDKVRLKVGYGRRVEELTYNLEGMKPLYPQYKECMGW